jgi:hypothetical protein
VTTLPHDFQDLYLAPVALAIDARLAELGALGDRELAVEIALASDHPDWTEEFRQEAVLRTIAHTVELHGWTLEWDARGIRLTHGAHTFVLGLPTNLEAYRRGAKADDAAR